VTRFIVRQSVDSQDRVDSEQLIYVEAEIVQTKSSAPTRRDCAGSIPPGRGQTSISLRVLRFGTGTNMPLVFLLVLPKSSKAPQFLSRPQLLLRSLRSRTTFKSGSGSRPDRFIWSKTGGVFAR